MDSLEVQVELTDGRALESYSDLQNIERPGVRKAQVGPGPELQGAASWKPKTIERFQGKAKRVRGICGGSRRRSEACRAAFSAENARERTSPSVASTGKTMFPHKPLSFWLERADGEKLCGRTRGLAPRGKNESFRRMPGGRQGRQNGAVV
jgi:hypothetical protein